VSRGGRADDIDVVERALEQLFRLNNRKSFWRWSAAAGVVISRPGFQLLRALHDDGPMTLSALSSITEMDPAATGRQVLQLEQDGLVSREASQQDGRSTIVAITSQGSKVRRRMHDVVHRHMTDVLGDWSATDRRKLGQLLVRLVEGFRSVSYRPAGDEEER
jgi:DNA-binding MarR family transcriptional regulator